MNNFEKPLYSIYPRIYCSGSVYINDVPVIDWYGTETEGRGGYGGEIIINHVLLQTGKYTAVGKMFAPFRGTVKLGESAIEYNKYLI